MNEKLINVFFGSDNLPYKDAERQIHFPIVGGAFLGASNTTKIRFYFDYIGNVNTTWVSVAKLPNGKQGSKVLPISSDENGNYAELELSNWYTQAKGDVYIALQGYQGGVEYSYDSETELYEIHGTPTIQTTGSIKLAINYAPIGDSPDYTDEFTTYQEILAALGDKANADSVYTKTETDTALDGKVDKTDSGNKVYATDPLGEQTTLTYGKDYYDNDAIVQRNSNGQLKVPQTPVDSYDATSKEYVDSQIATAISSVYKYKGSVSTYDNLPTIGVEVGDVYNVENTGDNYAWTGTTWDKLAGNIDLSDYYTKSDTDTLLSGKQNTLVSGTNIKSLTVDGVEKSLLGSGTIEVGTGGGGGAWGEITGDIQDQTDLQNELQDIREVAEGKNKTLVIRYGITAPTTDLGATMFKKADGTVFTNLADFNSYVSGLTLANPSFNTQGALNLIGYYLIGEDYIVYKDSYLKTIFKVGDIILVVETDVPDRWVLSIGSSYMFLGKLETTKVDLTNYATKTELGSAIDSVNDNIAPEYDSDTTYAIGDKVIYNGKLYTCTTAITTPESFDSTHWSQVSVASGFVDLDKAQVVSGDKNHTGALQKNGVDVATTDYFGFKSITYADYQALSDAEQNALLAVGVCIIGTIGTIKNPILFPMHDYTSYKQGIAIGDSGAPFIGSYEKIGSNSILNLRENAGGIKITDSLVRFINNISINQYYKKPQSSVSLSDGGTITDSTLKTLIQNEQPIKLNGFTCYFSCDDGTNYQYVSTRYDSSANKNHINVITINKSTWVATFHTSDLALS